MKLLPTLALTLALGLSSAAVLHAQDAPTTKPAARPTKLPNMTGDWAKMDTLTPEQKIKIAAIHKQANADKKAVEAKEEEDCLSLLTDEQKVEYEKVKETVAATAKEKAAAARKAKTATKPPASQPADAGT